MGIIISSKVQVYLLSISFMCIFTAFKTTNIISKFVLESFKSENPSFQGNGYTCLGIIYTTFSLTSLFSPKIVHYLSVKKSLVLSALLYVIYISSFIHPSKVSLCIFSAFIGVGAAVLWTAQGTFMTQISDEETIYRNTNIFWAFNEGSLLLGSSFIFWRFHGLFKIDSETRIFISSSLTLIGILGVIGLCFLNTTTSAFQLAKKEDDIVQKDSKLFMNIPLALFCISALYTGFQISFQSGIYASAIGFTKAFGPHNSVRLMGIIGILLGLGEITGGVIFGFICRSTNKKRSKIVQLGTICLILSYTIICFNLPNASTLAPNSNTSFLTHPSEIFCALAAFLMGFGDSCVQTQLAANVSVIFKTRPSPAFAIYKLVQSIGCAISFYFSSYIGLHPQLAILTLFSCFSLLALTFQRRYHEKLKFFLI